MDDRSRTKTGHLTRRPCRGRCIAWSRVPVMVGDIQTAIEYRLFVRLSTNAMTLMEAHQFPLDLLETTSIGGRHAIALTLCSMRRLLRWRRDQLDLANMGLADETPAPEMPA